MTNANVQPIIANPNDTIPNPGDSVSISPDTLGRLSGDTAGRASLDTGGQRVDTFSLRLSKDTLDAPVQYSAEDSAVVMIADKKIILYGQTETVYKDIRLTAPQVEIDQQTQVMTAFNTRDSTGTVTAEARFTQGENAFTSDTIRYNFKTQRGLTYNTYTQQGEMYVIGKIVKKVSDAVTYVSKGIFTTCNLDEPHFGFMANKIKIINQKLAVSGPAHPEFEGVPLPVILPFGFFPLSQGRHSGLLPPQFETNDQSGIGLSNLGYYKVMNDYWDVKVFGNIYSYGSWSVNLNPTYRRRYRYNGAFNIGLQRTKFNFKGDPDFFTNKSYTLAWNHVVDSKARPGTSFSASVNASSTSYNKYVPNDPRTNYNNLLGSSIAYSKTWQDKPYNLTVSANHNQNNQLGLVTVSLPDVGFTVSTLYPFRSEESIGNKWYEQLGIAYNGNFRNQVAFYDSAFKMRDLIDTLQWGARHSVPITLSLPPILGGAVVVSPSISYSQVWINQTFHRTWNPATKKVDTTVTKGFFVDHQSSMGLSFSTAFFGTYQFKKSRVYAIRHVIRPTMSINYQPDLSSRHYYTVQLDSTGDYYGRFSEFEGALYQGFGEGRYGGISFQVDNNLEMKVRPKKKKGSEELTDSTATAEPEEMRKVRLVDGYGFSSGYNFFADSMKLAPVQLYFRSNLFEKINLSANATLDPYQTDSRGRSINKYAWSGGKFNVGRITSASVSLSTNFQSKPRDEQKEKQKQQNLTNLKNDPTLLADQQRLLDYMRQNPAEFVDFNIPWSFNISYSLTFRQQFKPDYSGFEKVFTSSGNFSGNFSLTPKWMFSVNGYFDFDTRQLETFQMSISRDMHCWQMAINVTPIGPFRFFNFTISPKSGVLQDLRINRTRSFYTGY